MSFGADVVGASVVDVPSGHGGITILPMMDVDRTNGTTSGHIYIAWADFRNNDADIYIVRSTNGGTSWSTPLRVNDDPVGNGKDQGWPAVAVDPQGRVVVTFTDMRRSPAGSELYEMWGAISRDGGQTFDTNFLISEVPSDGALGGLGDYMGVAATSDHLYPLWTDFRSGADADLYTDRFHNDFAYDGVKNAAWSDKDSLGFTDQGPRFGVDMDYDVVDGLLSELRVDGGFGRAECAAALWPAPPFVDSRVPPDGDGRYYLVRAHGPAGVGTYGDGTPARPNVRDPLDESLPVCP